MQIIWMLKQVALVTTDLGGGGVMNILVIFYLNFQHAFDNRVFNADLVLIKC